MIKLIIADDHSIVREGLKQIIADTPDMAVVEEAGDGTELLQKTKMNAYDVVVLDITMPGPNVLDTLKQIKRQRPATQVLVLSMHPEEQYAIRVLKAGAAGYLNKESAPSELIKAIRKIAQGRKYLSPDFAENLADILLSDHDQPPHAALSDREYQVLCMLAAGETVKDIAESLFLSEKTVSTYRSRIMQKMGMKNNAELIHYAIKNMLVQ
jgi:DNA-binding NarL/FixJ family response regulator